MLFKVQAGKDVFKINEELKAIAEFEPLTSRQMLYVILATDYKTPFRKLAWPDRKMRAAVEAGYKLEKGEKRLDMNGRNLTSGKVPAVERAIKKYNILQRDEDYEALLGISKLIGDIRKLTGSSDKSLTELEKAVKFAKDLPVLMKVKKDLEDLLDMREDEVTDITAGSSTEEELIEDNLSELAKLNDEDDND